MNYIRLCVKKTHVKIPFFAWLYMNMHMQKPHIYTRFLRDQTGMLKIHDRALTSLHYPLGDMGEGENECARKDT